MCRFFSFVTDPEQHPGRKFYLDWRYRKDHDDDADSHSHIYTHFNLTEDRCNKYEYNPLTGRFAVDQINSEDGCGPEVIEEWVWGLNFKRIVQPLIIKPIIDPLTISHPTITPDDISNLKLWASVGASVGDSVWASVGALVWDSVGAYISSFFDISYPHDYTPLIRLWESGLVPSYDRIIWRLHTGEDAHVVYEWTPEHK